MAEAGKVTHRGGCHCGAVKYSVRAPEHLVSWICNCSICNMKKNFHFVVPAADFALDAGSEDFITTYTFNTGVAKHKFCKVCGVCSFYNPRSNPDGIAVTTACIAPETVKSVEERQFDGRNWEMFLEKSGISGFSKTDASEAGAAPAACESAAAE